MNKPLFDTAEKAVVNFVMSLEDVNHETSKLKLMNRIKEGDDYDVEKVLLDYLIEQALERRQARIIISNKTYLVDCAGSALISSAAWFDKEIEKHKFQIKILIPAFQMRKAVEI